MTGERANSVLVVIVLMSLPVVLRAQELTADVVVHRAKGEETRGKLYRGKNALRLEFQVEQPGAGRGTVVVCDLARQATYFLNPTMKTYVERSGAAGEGLVSLFVPQKDNPCALLPNASKDAACQKIGAEGVNGRSATKWRAIQTRGGKTTTEYAWVDSDLHIAIKWQTSNEDTGQLENIRLGSQAEVLFALPSDYRKIELPARTPTDH